MLSAEAELVFVFRIIGTLQSLSFKYTANGKRQIQVENFSKIENEQIKTA